MFIPFVGAVIQLKQQPMDVETETFVGIAGPMLGTLGALLCYLESNGRANLWMALAYTGYMINLFSLIPLSQMDGGRVLVIVSPKVWTLGLAVLGGYAMLHFNPLILMIIIALPRVIAAWRGTLQEPPRYYDASSAVRLKYLA